MKFFNALLWEPILLYLSMSVTFKRFFIFKITQNSTKINLRTLTKILFHVIVAAVIFSALGANESVHGAVRLHASFVVGALLIVWGVAAHITFKNSNFFGDLCWWTKVNHFSIRQKSRWFQRLVSKLADATFKRI